MGTDPRRLAADVLVAVEGGQWSDEALARALERSHLSDVDRGLATLLVYGVIARQRSLDHTIAAWSARAIDRLDPVVLIALRLGLFQMSFLDRVPDHAAVATSVDLVAQEALSAKGFVNALLRRAQREGLVPPPQTSGPEGFGIYYSHPDWLVSMWADELGYEEAESLLAANNEAAPTCYRALLDRDEAVVALRALGHDAHVGLHASTSLLVAGPVLQLEGLAVPQGEASQLVVDLLDPQPGWRVLDTCAAPGGKTAAIAARVRPRAVGATSSTSAAVGAKKATKGTDADASASSAITAASSAGASAEIKATADEAPTLGEVLACDGATRSVERIQATLANAGIYEGVHVQHCAVEALGGGIGEFDGVLVDAPCSGLGTLRQHPEIRWRRTFDDLHDLAGRQRSILSAASAFVKPGGVLVYSTCTISRIENDDVVDEFLATHKNFERQVLPNPPNGLAALCDETGTLRTFPHRDGIDGFFAVRMRRKSS